MDLGVRIQRRQANRIDGRSEIATYVDARQQRGNDSWHFSEVFARIAPSGDTRVFTPFADRTRARNPLPTSNQQPDKRFMSYAQLLDYTADCARADSTSRALVALERSSLPS